MKTKTALLATLLLAAAACQKEGGSSNPPTTGGDGTDTPTTGGDVVADDGGAGGDGGAAGEAKWADMDFDARKEWMGVEVLPKMKALFKEYDEAQFKGFKCQTCHGDDGKEKSYAMPTDSIYPLPEAEPVKAAMEYDEAMTKFMVDKVVPDMAALLHAEPYNPETGEGTVGCFTCHPKE